MFEIEKNVALPTPRVKKSKYPFSAMEIGDSFFVPVEGRATQRRITSAAGTHSKRHGGRFTIRMVEGGYRCWRVA